MPGKIFVRADGELSTRYLLRLFNKPRDCINAKNIDAFFHEFGGKPAFATADIQSTLRLIIYNGVNNGFVGNQHTAFNLTLIDGLNPGARIYMPGP